MTDRSASGRRSFVYPALVISGLAALIYELLWVRILGQLFGHTIFAVSTVLSVFFLGLALGASLASIMRKRAAAPLKVVALLEIGIAACGLLLPLAARAVTPLYDRWAPLETETAPAFAARLILSIILLIVPATMMGATFPLVASVRSRSIASVYAANTIGGALGVWLTGFVILPGLGLATLGVAAALNGIAALGFWLSGEDRAPVPRPSTGEASSPRLAAVLIFLTGAAALMLEVLWTRALEQVLSGTIYTFATVLAVFLLGLGLGSALLRRYRAHHDLPDAIVSLLVAASVLVALSLIMLALLPRLHAAITSRFPHGVAGVVATESLLSILLFIAPATVMGALFPLLLEWGDGGSGGRIGTLTAFNTIGSTAGPLIASLLLPFAGLGHAIRICSALFALIALTVAFRTKHPPRRRVAMAGAMGALLLLILPAGFFRDRSRGERVIASRDDSAATVAVVEEQDNGRRLKVNNSYSLGGGGGVFTERRQGHLPMLLHPHPERVLVLGLGTGNTLAAVATHNAKTLTAVELLETVVEFAERFFSDTNGGVVDDPAVSILVADATRVVRSYPGRLDVVIGDLYHPWQAGVGSLYALEHFEEVREHLAPGGIFVQWLPLYQLSESDVKCIVRTFSRAFPAVEAWLGNFGTSTPIVALVGSIEPLRFAAIDGRWQSALRDPESRSALSTVYLDQRPELYGSFVSDRDALLRWAGNGPVNTARRPRIEFSAAAAYYSGELEKEKERSLTSLLVEAAAYDRRPQNRFDAPALSNRRAVRAMFAAQISAGRGQWRDSATAAIAAADAAVGYALPRRMLTIIGSRLVAPAPREAERIFRKAVALEPADPRGWNGLGQALAQQKRLSEARVSYENALRLDPANQVARTALSSLPSAAR